MAMAILFTWKSSANASLILCIIVASFVSKALGHHGRADRKDPNERVFNVLRYGARPGREDNTLASLVFWIGKGKATYPQGNLLDRGNYLSGTIKVQIAVTLKAVPDPSMYEEDFWILFENINGFLVTGTGTVDGQGNAVWKYNVSDGGAKFVP
ncbi:hypothetical protein Peur_019200 [Populus x canadensis]